MDNNKSSIFFWPCKLQIGVTLSKKILWKKKSNWYSLTSPCGHLYNTDTSLLRTVCLIPEMPKIIHYLPLQYGHLCKADTWFSHFGVRIKEVWLYVQWYSVICFSRDLFLNTAVKRQKV